MIEVNLLGAITATEIIGLVLSRPRRLAINEIPLRPAGQQ